MRVLKPTSFGDNVSFSKKVNIHKSRYFVKVNLLNTNLLVLFRLSLKKMKFSS